MLLLLVFPPSDVSMQLGTAQSRCSLLEKQLDYMRKMVVSAELEKRLVLEKQVFMFVSPILPTCCFCCLLSNKVVPVLLACFVLPLSP